MATQEDEFWCDMLEKHGGNANGGFRNVESAREFLSEVQNKNPPPHFSHRIERPKE